MGILLKEHFNRWYSLKSYYISVTLLDLPISVTKKKLIQRRKKKKSERESSNQNLFRFNLMAISISFSIVYIPQFIGTSIFTVLIYTITSQPFELSRFCMFLAISIIVTIVGQSIGLMVGAWFDVVVSSCAQICCVFLFFFHSSSLSMVLCAKIEHFPMRMTTTTIKKKKKHEN